MHDNFTKTIILFEYTHLFQFLILCKLIAIEKKHVIFTDIDCYFLMRFKSNIAHLEYNFDKRPKFHSRINFILELKVFDKYFGKII